MTSATTILKPEQKLWQNLTKLQILMLMS